MRRSYTAETQNTELENQCGKNETLGKMTF
jgi:hypothetical protein